MLVVENSREVVLVGLYNSYIVQRFNVIRSMFQCIFIGLYCEISLAKHGIDISDVVPEVAIGKRIFFALDDGSFEAGVEEVILMVGKTAEGHVVPQLEGFIAQFN